ncbi:hypothetical protein ACFFOO_16435 [Mucilaginibacter ginsenosidivorans]
MHPDVLRRSKTSVIKGAGLKQSGFPAAPAVAGSLQNTVKTPGGNISSSLYL